MGWVTAMAMRYALTSQVVQPALTPKSSRMGTRATAIIVEFRGAAMNPATEVTTRAVGETLKVDGAMGRVPWWVAYEREPARYTPLVPSVDRHGPWA